MDSYGSARWKSKLPFKMDILVNNDLFPTKWMYILYLKVRFAVISGEIMEDKKFLLISHV